MSKAESSLQPKISCIVNPRAARNKWWRRRKLRNYLQENLPGEIIDNQENKEGTIEAARKKSLESEIIVAVGGDGTVADVIQGIIESRKGKDVLLGFVPLGSGNAFRKSLGIPRNVKKALRLLAEGATREIDLIDIEGRMAGFASIGATARVTQEKLQHKMQGLLGHLLASRILFSLPRKEQVIELIEGRDDSGEQFDKRILRLSLFDCVVGKTNYFGYNWRAAPKAKVDDGYLDITLFETSGPKYFFYFPLIYLGLYQRRQKHFKARKMTLIGQSLSIQYNGEFLGVRDRVEFRVLPKALRIICSAKKSK